MGIRNMNGYVEIGVEDEVHFILYCLMCDTFRLKYLPRKYFTEPNINKSNILMSSRSASVIHAVASYRHSCIISLLCFQITQRNKMFECYNVFYQFLCHTCVHTMLLYVCYIHVLWAGGLNRNKPFVLVLMS